MLLFTIAIVLVATLVFLFITKKKTLPLIFVKYVVYVVSWLQVMDIYTDQESTLIDSIRATVDRFVPVIGCLMVVDLEVETMDALR